MAAPRTRRGLASGWGSVRMSTTPTVVSRIGTSTTDEPITVRRAVSIQAPTGPAAPNHVLAAITTATPSNASAMPSRRWPGSRSRARPTERAVLPAPLATISQPARAARPIADPAVLIGDGERRGAGFRRGAGRAGRLVPREPVFDLVERAPERAAVLLAMAASLVALTPISPSATLVTSRYQSISKADHGVRFAHERHPCGRRNADVQQDLVQLSTPSSRSRH